MIWMVVSLTFIGLCMAALVAVPFALVHVTAEWWFSDDSPRRKPPEPIPATRKCMGCGAGYYSGWDPIDFTPERARRDRSWMSGGLCPNCSGAD